MPKQPADDPRLANAKAYLKRQNRLKVIRTVFQAGLLAVAITLAVLAILKNNAAKTGTSANTQTAVGIAAHQSQNEGKQFIAISYPGLTKSTSLDSKIVNLDLYEEQLTALRNSGYVTISQNDILNYYLYYGSLPDKALFLLFEDGLLSSVSLAQDALVKNGYQATLCTYANNLDRESSPYVTGAVLKALANVSCWETGTNGYRLSYINVFDRYANFFGALNLDEFVRLNTYMWRDYNHYLMDFIRDEDRLRVETEDELRTRIAQDYEKLRTAYLGAIGYVPGLYVLMHANTGAFATDAIASEANRENITGIFTMNFNREGTCLNTTASSIYDLSRLQVQSYFSTNHLLMRIWDDTGEPLQFVTGDEDEAAHWFLDGGAAQFKGNEIVLTSLPAGKAQLTLKSRLFADLDMTVTLKGNEVGRQSVYLRTDRMLEHGLEVALEDNKLIVDSIGSEHTQLFEKDLFELDGGPFISTQEDEYNGLVALQNAIIQFDTDPARIAAATKRLQELQNTPVLTLADGGTPYYPVNDTSDRASRKVRIRLVGSRLSVWVDDKPVADQLKVPGVQLGSVALGAAVFENNNAQFTQHNIYDDVYDAVFDNLQISDAQNSASILYEYRLTPDQTINSTISGWFNAVIDFFVDHF